MYTLPEPLHGLFCAVIPGVAETQANEVRVTRAG